MAKSYDFNEAAERKRLSELVKQLPEDRRKAAAGLIADMAFQCEQLEKLRQEIRENGVVETYQNGATQSGRKQSVASVMYLALSKQYAQNLKTLASLLPNDKTADSLRAGEALAAFVAKGK